MTVYFIQTRAHRGYIKIGTAEDVSKRLNSLQTGTPHTLRIIYQIPGGAEVEREMHQRFAHLRYRGEWFRPGKDLLAFCGVGRKRIPAAPPNPAWDAIVEDIERHIYANPVTPDPGTPLSLIEEHERYMAGLHARFGSVTPPSARHP